MTHLLSSSRTTSDTPRPSAFAFSAAVSQMYASTRMDRSGRSGIDGLDESGFEPACGQLGVPADVVATAVVFEDGAEVSGLDVLDALIGSEGSGKGGDDRATHTDHCTSERIYTQESECLPDGPSAKERVMTWIGVRPALACMTVGAVVAALVLTPPAHAVDSGPDRALAAVRASGGHYRTASASLPASDCSGLVSVAQSIAMGKPIRRLGDTRSLLAGRWPGAIAGATPGDIFVIATSPTHMVAMIQGIGIESRQSGEPYRIGSDATSPWDAQFTARFHVDPKVLV